jgi:hypothetical protein
MQIVHEPYEKLSFRSYLEYESPELLASTIGLAAPSHVAAQMTLRWSNGVLFVISGFQNTDIVTKEFVTGHLIWGHIDFALMPEYRKEIKLPDKPMLTTDVLDLSDHTVFGPFGAWIKENLAKKGRQVAKQ